MAKKEQETARGKPVSLYPLNFDDALRALLQSEPEETIKIKRRNEKKPGTEAKD